MFQQSVVVFAFLILSVHANGGHIVQAPEDYISQQNIGIPGGDAISSGSGRGRYGVAPGTGTSASFTSAGGGETVPLAVNSRQMVMYVDVPSTRSMSSGAAIAGSHPISQQNIGIPGSYGGGVISGASGTGISSSSGLSRPLASSGFVPQQNIGIPGSYGGGTSRVGAIGSGGVIMGGGYPSGGGGVIQLPVHSRHSVQYVDVPSTGSVQPVSLEIPATNLGVNLNFKSSSNIKVTQSHQGSPGSYQETSSVDEPIRLSHTVRRPIIQEVRETIQPFRKVVQEVQPVQEEVHQIIAVAAGSRPGGTPGGYSGAGHIAPAANIGSFPGAAHLAQAMAGLPGAGHFAQTMAGLPGAGNFAQTMAGFPGAGFMAPGIMGVGGYGPGYGTAHSPNKIGGSKTRPGGGGSAVAWASSGPMGVQHGTWTDGTGVASAVVSPDGGSWTGGALAPTPVLTARGGGGGGAAAGVGPFVQTQTSSSGQYPGSRKQKPNGGNRRFYDGSYAIGQHKI